MRGEQAVEREDFIRRLVQLRMQKNVSARDMSLSIGQSAGYINNIESGVSLPSMTVFFYICDYLGLTPAEFFDVDAAAPERLRELIRAAKGLTREQLDSLAFIARCLKEGNDLRRK